MAGSSDLRMAEANPAAQLIFQVGGAAAAQEGARRSGRDEGSEPHVSDSQATARLESVLAARYCPEHMFVLPLSH